MIAFATSLTAAKDVSDPPGASLRMTCTRLNAARLPSQAPIVRLKLAEACCSSPFQALTENPASGSFGRAPDMMKRSIS